VGAAALAFLVLGIVLFGRDWRRERDYLGERHLWRGEALISSLEVLSRPRPDEPWAAAGLQNFWDSLTDDEQVLFIALTDGQGRLRAWAGRLEPPSELFEAESPEEARQPSPELFQPQFRLAEAAGLKMGLVNRRFWPMPVRHGHRMIMRGRPGAAQNSWPVIRAWVGFDLSALDRAGRRRARSAALSIGLFCLTGLAVMLALFAGHNVRLTRRLYQEAKAELARK
jgi:hypothetical protein